MKILIVIIRGTINTGYLYETDRAVKRFLKVFKSTCTDDTKFIAANLENAYKEIEVTQEFRDLIMPRVEAAKRYVKAKFKAFSDIITDTKKHNNLQRGPK